MDSIEYIATNTRIGKIATRVMDVDYYGALNAGASVETIMWDISTDPLTVIEWLLDEIDELQEPAEQEDKQDIEVSRSAFLKLYYQEVDKFNRDEDSHIYGDNFTVHWNGIYCDLEDGATVYNHLIPALKNIQDELD